MHERAARPDEADDVDRDAGTLIPFVPARRSSGQRILPATVRPIAASEAVLYPELGPLAEFVREDTTDLLLNGGVLWSDRGGGLLREAGWRAPTDADSRELAVTLIARGGRHLDDATPCVDVRLPGGVRVHAVLPPVAPAGPLVSVRIPAVGRRTLAELVSAGLMARQQADALAAAVRARANILVTGASGAGKTTLLAALLAEVPHSERIVCVEDVAELRIPHPHAVSLEARQPNTEGAGGIGLERLVREALRMRPDRIVLGECRGPELRELLTALNTGHDGGAGTLHANRLADVPARLEALGALAGMTPEALARQAVSALDVVLHLERRDGTRRVASVGRLALSEHNLLTVVETE
ncbi:MAG: type II/type pathway secretion protein [Naasia sp.]|jgi:pilus assembly protein CpaF|uniref:TadA family conjugal transfer-associated ATPase n=1 Tax=Naasia sp. TaxID=2546198 RepID=UPI00262E270C|nr:TadA family conjugal transfer-associated ATPase [Naasia sp.]MCU1570743.1 type II/type pathway secretion protein [Naasia sp.]